MSTRTESGSSERAGRVGPTSEICMALPVSLLCPRPFPVAVGTNAHGIACSSNASVHTDVDPSIIGSGAAGGACAVLWLLAASVVAVPLGSSLRCECARQRSSECTPPQCSCPPPSPPPPLCLCVRVGAVHSAAVGCAVLAVIGPSRPMRPATERGAEDRRQRDTTRRVDEHDQQSRDSNN